MHVSRRLAAGCAVTCTVSTQWPGGFTANVNVTNLGDPVTSWQLTWSFAAGQTVTQLWDGTATQSGARVTVANASWNGDLATGGTTSFGFNGSWDTSANPAPARFALNGTPRTGSTVTPSPTPSSSISTTPPAGTVPGSFSWQSSGGLVSPKPDATHNIIAVKDPSVVYCNGKRNVFASTVDASGNCGMEYLSFTDWSQAGSATPYYLDQTAIGSGYKTAPMVFYFAPRNCGTESDPFARWSDVTFPGTPWTQDISSGEAIRSGYDQNGDLSPCKLQYLFQGVAPAPAAATTPCPGASGCSPRPTPHAEDTGRVALTGRATRPARYHRSIR